jgi:hypothetical protein
MTLTFRAIPTNAWGTCSFSIGQPREFESESTIINRLPSASAYRESVATVGFAFGSFSSRDRLGRSIPVRLFFACLPSHPLPIIEEKTELDRKRRMTQLTVSLSDRASQEAFLRAASQGTTVDELVKEIVEEALVPGRSDPLQAAANLTDDEILAMADYQLSAAEQSRLNQLLRLNSEGCLTPEQGAELDALMKHYDEGIVRKSIGWAEAVRRRLRNPPI